MAGLTLQPGEKDLRKIVDVVRQLTEGKSNAVGTFTLAVSPATTTTVQAPTCSPTSVILPSALTADAAAALGAMSFTPGMAQFVVTHAASALSDRTFGYLVAG